MGHKVTRFGSIFEYDEDENLIYVNFSSGDWIKYTFTKLNKVNSAEYSNGHFIKYIHDSEGEVIACIKKKYINPFSTHYK
jgi:hypothetical protein